MTRPDEETCPLAQTTTIAWLYGEAPDDHVHHVARCEDCSAVAAEHADTLATVGPVLDALSEVPAALPAAEAAPDPSPRAANRPWVFGALALVAVAAVTLLALWLAPSAPDAAPAPELAVVDELPPPPREPVLDEQDPEIPAPPEDVFADVELDDLVVPAPLDNGVPTPDDPRVADLDLLDLGDADEAFEDGLDGLLDDFAALEADLATL